MQRIHELLKKYILLAIGIGLLVWGVMGIIQVSREAGWLLDEADQVDSEGFLPFDFPSLVSKGTPQVAPTLMPEMEVESTEAIPTSYPTPQPEQTKEPAIPERIVIPSIGLDAPIVEAKTRNTWLAAEPVEQWLAPDEFAAGWHTNSAKLGEVGNVVLNGHHNTNGSVFKDLVKLDSGDLIIVTGGDQTSFYQVANKMILKERAQQPEVRWENARWILPSEDSRLTLVTCWPPESNTHRLILVARLLQ